MVKQIYQPFIKDNLNKMHYNLQGSQCHRLTGKGGSRRETLIYPSPLYIVGNTQLADNDWCIKQQTNKQNKHSHSYKYTHK